MTRRLLALFALPALLLAPRSSFAQERGAAAFSEAVEGLGTTTRVLMIGAHPDDEDTNLIAWLARGRHVETAYLSLTRGDGGQNLIGDELGEALGVIRTEELLAARRVDGGRQFFSRAYDFGFSKSAEETLRHWPKDTLLGDVVQVVRTFRPHVIVAVFSGTPRDGHGHHQVSGLLAREAYDVAGDSIRFPRARYGAPWTPLKFYRAARFNPDAGTARVDVGEYDPVLGRSFAEIAGESRSQHKSQGFGALQRKGQIWDYVRREATRVNERTDAKAEASLFDGVDTTWARFRTVVSDARQRAALDSLPAVFAAANRTFDARHPERVLPALQRARALLGAICPEEPHACGKARPAMADLESTLASASARVDRALQLAAGLEIDATVTRPATMVGAPTRVEVRVYNRGRLPASIDGIVPIIGRDDLILASTRARPVAPGGVLVDTVDVVLAEPTRPWWLVAPRRGDLFASASTVAENLQNQGARIAVIGGLDVAGSRLPFSLMAPVEYRYAHQVRGEVRVPLAVVPAVSVTLDDAVAYARAGVPLDRQLLVRLRSADTAARDVTVRLELPAGLTADSAARTVRLAGYDAQRAVVFRLRGGLAPGRHAIRVRAESAGETFATGYQLVEYEHIRPQRLYRPAELALEAVDVELPANVTVAYVPGVGDNIPRALAQLGVPMTIVQPGALATAELDRFSTVVVGPRAMQAFPAVTAASSRLLDYARRGGRLVVQYQQDAIARPGLAPLPMTFARPADRVTEETAAVTIVDSASVLRTPNRIGDADWAGWVQERSLYMPRTFAEGWQAPLETHDPGEPPNRGALLVAPVGRGTYVYTTLSFFRQLPAGVPGAARLFVNLLAAEARPAVAGASEGER
ncbi:MAG TPA: PIG-L family deacetylase [Gemmatimonadaceae bacterium]|nr:PIG-L family deacetylase [Gemmatimonadaceae bacterium]